MEGDGGPSDRRMDLDGDTVMDSVNIDNDGATAEWINPRLDGGTMYCGLTTAGAPLISLIPAGGATPNLLASQINFKAKFVNGGFQIEFATAVEANVAGFNIYRTTVPGDSTNFVKVNDNLIPASGVQAGNLYNFLDDNVRIPRRSYKGSFTYKVEVVGLDGTTTLVGPFTAYYASEGRRGRTR